jgi:hypothetical protein
MMRVRAVKKEIIQRRKKKMMMMKRMKKMKMRKRPMIKKIGITRINRKRSLLINKKTQVKILKMKKYQRRKKKKKEVKWENIVLTLIKIITYKQTKEVPNNLRSDIHPRNNIAR